MSQIRCLGPVGIPEAYKRYFAKQRANFRAEYGTCGRSLKAWDLTVLHPRHTDDPDTYMDALPLDEDDYIPVYKPVRNPRLTEAMTRFGSGRQEHNLMTLIETDVHNDTREDMLDQAIVIPYRLHKLHRLCVDGEVRQLEVGHAYSFNQQKFHQLFLDDTRIPFRGENPMPASLIVIGYLRK